MDEPRRHRGFMAVLGLLALATAPFPFIGAEPRMLLGLPLWLWWSIVMTVAFAALTSWGFGRYWKDR